MKKRNLAMACLGLFSIISYSVVHAGNRPCSGTFSLGEGYYIFSSKRHIDNTGITFGTLGFNFTQNLGIEGLLGFFTTDSRRPIDNGKEVNGSLFSIDAVYRFPSYRCFESYISAGPGVISMNPNGFDPDTEGNVNAGVGVEYFFSEIVSLRLDARDFYTIVGGKNDVFFNGSVNFVF